MHARIIHFIIGLSLLLGVVSTSSASPVATAPATSDGTAAAIELRNRIAAFFQGGTTLADLPPSNALHPLRRTPVLATTVWLLFEDDPAALGAIYPSLARMVTAPFERGAEIHTGLLTGSFAPGDGAAISPAVNGLLALELRSLALIAGRIDKSEDALELFAWSRDYATAIRNACFDPDREGFFPRREDGTFVFAYRPEQLLPLVTTELAPRAAGRLADRFAAAVRAAPPPGGGLWDDPASRPLVKRLLEAVPGMTAKRIAAFAGPGKPFDEAHGAWIDFWREAPVERLRPAAVTIASLELFNRIALRESLLLPGTAGPLGQDIGLFEARLDAGALDLDDYLEAVSAANRLLAAVSRLSAVIEEETRIWKAMDENAWRGLSPRTRKLLVAAIDAARGELMAAKAALTDGLERGTGIAAELRLPDGPIPLGSPVELELFLRGGGVALPLRDVYLQVGTKRWRLDEAAGGILSEAGGAPWKTTRPFAVPPGTEPGLLVVPWFVDARGENGRIELHGTETLSLSRGCAATMDLPRGRLIAGDGVPVTVTLRHVSASDIQGTIEGVLPRELATDPELPARFHVRAGEPLTTLPLLVRPAGTLPPGVYPIAVFLRLHGRTVARFEDELVRPMSFFYLGPLPDASSALRGAPGFQDDLLRIHRTTDGNELRWREVPAGACDAAGSILPGRLSGTAPDGGMIFYSLLDAPRAATVVWRIETPDRAAVWINGDRVLEPAESGAGRAGGTTLFRSGANAILVAIAWERSPAPLLFTITDENGYPVADLGNDLDRLIDGFELLAAPAAPAGVVTEPDRPRETTLSFHAPDAASVHLVGTFNNWDPGATPMSRSDDGAWSASIPLLPGRYEYKFVVDGRLRITDPACERSEPDGFGGFNSVLVVR